MLQKDNKDYLIYPVVNQWADVIALFCRNDNVDTINVDVSIYKINDKSLVHNMTLKRSGCGYFYLNKSLKALPMVFLNLA